MQELCLIRFHPATEEEEVAYISLYSYFSSRGRFGVVANNSRHIKDLYLIPLSAKDPVPSKLLPFEGPGKRQCGARGFPLTDEGPWELPVGGVLAGGRATEAMSPP